jgi:hypothetical protein
MATSRALVQFKEQRYQVYFNDFRVFIQGVEVTPWVTSSLVVTRANRDGPGTASFTLDNAMDRFVITKENLSGHWRDTSDRYSEASKHAIYLYKTGASDVTIDRIGEMVKVLYERALDRAKVCTADQLAAELGSRKLTKGMKSDRAYLENATAQKNALEALPADLFTSKENREKVAAAFTQQLVDSGEMLSIAQADANTAVHLREVQITQAGGKHPKKSSIQELNPDGSAAEGRGRHKRQKTLRNPIDSDTGDARWPLDVRSVVFHKNDPIRIFVHNPLTEPHTVDGKHVDHWLYGFTGFLDTYPVQTDYVNGVSNISIQCYDIRSPMQKMRVQQNVTLPTVEPTALFEDRSSIFADLIVPSRFGQAYANMKFEDAMATLITGTNLARQGQGRRFGIGDFAVGKVVRYPSAGGSENPTDPTNIAILEEWHTLCLNGSSNISDASSIANLAPLTPQDVDRIGRGTTSDGPYSPVRGLVHFLLPKTGTAAHTLTQQSFDGGSEQRDFISRLEIVQEFCARLDYEMTVLPNGDIVFEFPMYDFLPKDFGAYENVFTVDAHLISGNMQDESGDIVTAVVVTGGPQLTDVNPDSNTVGSLRPIGVVQSSLLASRVGMTVEMRSLPFVRDKGRLRSLGMLEFQKALANANTLDNEFGFRPFITPNRPVLNVAEQRMGLTSSVTETMQMFSTCSTGLGLRYIRQVRSDDSFRFITGGAFLPISYRKTASANRKSVGDATVGLRTSMEMDGDAGSSENQKADQVSVEPENDDRPPAPIREARSGTYFSLTPSARRVADLVAQVVSQADLIFLLTSIPNANSRSFGIRARDPEGRRLFTDNQRKVLAIKAKDNGYILIDTRQRFVFEPRQPGQPDFIVRPENER